MFEHLSSARHIFGARTGAAQKIKARRSARPWKFKRNNKSSISRY